MYSDDTKQYSRHNFLMIFNVGSFLFLFNNEFYSSLNDQIQFQFIVYILLFTFGLRSDVDIHYRQTIIHFIFPLI